EWGGGQMSGMGGFVWEGRWMRDRTGHRAIRCGTSCSIQRPELSRWQLRVRRFFLSQGQRLLCLQTEQTPESSGRSIINLGRKLARAHVKWSTPTTQQIWETSYGIARKLLGVATSLEERSSSLFRLWRTERFTLAGKAR